MSIQQKPFYWWTAVPNAQFLLFLHAIVYNYYWLRAIFTHSYFMLYDWLLSVCHIVHRVCHNCPSVCIFSSFSSFACSSFTSSPMLLVPFSQPPHGLFPLCKCSSPSVLRALVLQFCGWLTVGPFSSKNVVSTFPPFLEPAICFVLISAPF